MNKVKEIRSTFENGDILILSLKECTFVGFKPAKLWELYYGEKQSDNHFIVIQPEYFPASMFGTAQSAFSTRMSCSNPTHESDRGFSIEYLLSKNK